MLAILTISLFVAGAIASIVVLADGAVRARNAWHALRSDLTRIDAMDAALVRVTTCTTAVTRAPALRPLAVSGCRSPRRAVRASVSVGMRAAA